MKFLFFHRWVGNRLGGSETHIKKIADGLIKNGHQIDFLTVEGSLLDDFNSGKPYLEN